MTKKLSIIFIVLLFVQPIFSQELKEMEIEPVPEGESIKFVNRNPNEAILIVHSKIPVLNFESNRAIIGVDNPDPGEYRLHLEPGTHIITFKADGYSMEQERYYIPKLKYKEVQVKPKKQVVLQTEETQDITFQLNISNAIPVIDGIQGQPQFDKTIVIPLPEGGHDIQFLASGYKHSDVKIVKVRMGEQQTIPINLRKDTEMSIGEIPEILYETISFQSELSSVELIVDGVNRGYINPIGTNVDLSASVDGTIHQVTCKKSKYHPETFAITVYRQKVNPPVKVKLKPNFGTLVVKCKQGDAKIYINDKLNRKTATIDGEVFEEFQSGTYKIRVEKERYFPSKEQDVVVKDGDKATVEFDLQARWGDLSLTSAPSAAVVYLDNEIIGQTPFNLQGENEGLLEGDYKINLTLHSQFYPDEERTIEIKAGMPTVEHVVFTDISGKIRVDYMPKPINIFINGNLDDDLSSGKPKRFSEGSYKIQIQKVGSHKDSYKPVERSVVLYRGKEEVIEGKLPEKNGRIYISSNIGSPVFSIVDLETGEPIFEDSRNPNMLVLTGKYKISADLSSEGYISQTKTVDITEGFSDRIVFEFTEQHKQAWIMEQERNRREELEKQKETKLVNQKTGKLQFSIYPLESVVTMGNSDGNIYKIWEGPQIIEDVPVGDYILYCKSQYYSSEMRNITISENQVQKIEVGLKQGYSTTDHVEKKTPFKEYQTWEGWYKCSNIKTDLSVKIISCVGNRITAIFKFDTGKVKGSYYVTGEYNPSTHAIDLKPNKWINKPFGYVMVGIMGTVSGNGRTWNGDVTNGRCDDFMLTLTRLKTGKLHFNIYPQGSTVTMKSDDGSIYKTWNGAQTLENVPVGNYILYCKTPNYASQERYVNITENKVQKIDMTLTKGYSGKSALKKSSEKVTTNKPGTQKGGLLLNYCRLPAKAEINPDYERITGTSLKDLQQANLFQFGLVYPREKLIWEFGLETVSTIIDSSFHFGLFLSAGLEEYIREHLTFYYGAKLSWGSGDEQAALVDDTNDQPIATISQGYTSYAIFSGLRYYSSEPYDGLVSYIDVGYYGFNFNKKDEQDLIPQYNKMTIGHIGLRVGISIIIDY